MSADNATETNVETTRYDSVRAEISREMVRLYKEQFGRGPTKARTEFAGPDIVICTRMYFQYATENEFRGTIERITGRPVRAFISGIDAAVDVSCEIFHLGRNGETAGPLSSD